MSEQQKSVEELREDVKRLRGTVVRKNIVAINAQGDFAHERRLLAQARAALTAAEQREAGEWRGEVVQHLHALVNALGIAVTPENRWQRIDDKVKQAARRIHALYAEVNAGDTELGRMHQIIVDAKAVLEDYPAEVDYSKGVNGAGMIAAERARQISEEGWTPGHDDSHVGGQLKEAAHCYLGAAVDPRATAQSWPWEIDSWKPSLDPIRNLVKAGALIAAEIDRLHHLTPADESEGE